MSRAEQILKKFKPVSESMKWVKSPHSYGDGDFIADADGKFVHLSRLRTIRPSKEKAYDLYVFDSKALRDEYDKLDSNLSIARDKELGRIKELKKKAEFHRLFGGLREVRKETAEILSK